MIPRRTHILLVAVLLFVAACSNNDTADAAPNSSGANGGNGGDRAGGSQGGGSGGPGGGTAGGRQPATVTLAAADIAVVKRGIIEEGVAITGDLRPIETVEIRARLEGDLIGVYVREGQRVKAGQVLARFEASEQESGLISAKADQLAAKGELATAQWNLDQTTELFRAGAVAERDFKMAQQTQSTAAARLAAADARVRATSSLVSDTRAVATTDGVISRRVVENGEHVSRGSSMFTLVRADVLELAAAVPARFGSTVKVGQTVSFNADGRTFDGKVARVSPTVDPTTRTVTVYIQILNPADAIKGGTFASGRVVSRTIEKALRLPSAAVRLTGDGQPYVYRLAGKTIDIASVQLGVVDERGGVAELLDGLNEGDRVIVGNVGTLGRGMQVVIAGEEGIQSGAPGRRPPGSKQSP